MSRHILHVASEVVPFSKTGGLADVLGALPRAQAALGHSVTVVAPAHRSELGGKPPGRPAGSVAALGLRATVMASTHEGVEILLLDCPSLYVRPALYSLPDGEFPDNAQRFAFLSSAALTLAQDRGADVLHAHDWQAALAPLLAHHQGVDFATVLTVHNLGYQGVFAPWVLEACGLPKELFSLDGLEFYGRVNFLKGGLASADALTTVSPTYAEEILTPRFGCGLEGVLTSRKGALTGILNGLDVETWDPAHDPNLPQAFDETTVIAGKAAARHALAKEASLADGERPIAGMVSRLAEQKGADLVAAAIEPALALGFDIVVLGTGEPRYEELLRGAELAHPGRVRLFRRFDERLAHLIYGGADVFLMPSRYEPCGLGQMTAMRYGTLPVVNRTGGLADTVADAGEPGGTGFVLAELTPQALVETLRRARAVLADPERLAALRRCAMGRDFSWDASARKYIELYEQVLATRPSSH